MSDESKEGLAPQVKICGLTRVDEALACAESGVHAIGCVFYPKSPRCVSTALARELRRALPARVAVVGVFVNEPFSKIMRTVEEGGLDMVQLHGAEPPELVERIRAQGVGVVKAFYANGEPSLEALPSYGNCSCLVEWKGGRLPGGNALAWDWSVVKGVSRERPLVLAGGLTPENVARAVAEAQPDAVDASSGVESSPGRKDPEKVRLFLSAVRRTVSSPAPGKVFDREPREG